MKKILCSIRAIYKITFLFLILLVPRCSLYSQVNLNYKEIFGKQYFEAINYLNSNQWITNTLIRNKIDPCFAKSVIFPELIRYSYIRDKMEIQALKTLYVQYGPTYADFSIGRFQIKPTFAEKLETDLKTIACFKHDAEVEQIDTAQTNHARLQRVKRLDSEKWQVQYLIWFIKVMDYKYPSISGSLNLNHVWFYATAYNCGYYLPEKQIRENMAKNYFHTALFSSNERYNYGSVSSYFWSQCRQSEK